MKWSAWEGFPVDSIKDITSVDFTFIDRKGCFSIGRDFSTKEFYSVTFNNFSHLRFLDEGARFSIFSDHIAPEFSSKAGLKIKNYTFAEELKVDSSFTDYFIHSDHFCPEYLSQYEPILEKLGNINPFLHLKDHIFPRLHGLRINIKKDNFKKHLGINSDTPDDLLVVEPDTSETAKHEFYFLYAMISQNEAFLVFEDRIGNFYSCTDVFRFQLTYKPVLTNATRAIENAIVKNKSLSEFCHFRVRDSKFIRLANELDFLTNRYDPNSFSTVLRFDMIDFESSHEMKVVLSQNKNLEELISEQAQLCVAQTLLV